MTEKVTNVNQAIGILIQAAELGIEKGGVFNVNDIEMIINAKNFIIESSSKSSNPEENKKEDEVPKTEIAKKALETPKLEIVEKNDSSFFDEDKDELDLL